MGVSTNARTFPRGGVRSGEVRGCGGGSAVAGLMVLRAAGVEVGRREEGGLVFVPELVEGEGG